MRNYLILATLCTLVTATGANATNVLITENQGGGLGSVQAFDTVFGSGTYTNINSYASVDTAAVFSAANPFVFLDGGANSDTALDGFLAGNGNTVLNWVQNGGNLFIQAGGWNQSISFGPATLFLDPAFSNANIFGHLTPAGSGAFTGYGISSSNYAGFFLANTTVVGNGLSVFMEGDALDDGAGGLFGGGNIIAGLSYGNGYIMYSGLTDTDPDTFTNDAAPVLANAIAFTAAQTPHNTVPEPFSVALMGAALAVLSLSTRKIKKL
jgi:hypothetical protein